VEVRQIIKRLLEHKLALACVLVAAVVLAYLAGTRTPVTTSGAATTQILIDAPQSALANLKQNTLPLTTRAGMFAQFMASTAVRESIADAAGVPATEIVAKGPFDDPDAAPTGVTTSSEAAAPAVEPKYVLTFVAQEELPLVTVYAQGPDAKSASKLAGAVAEGVESYVAELQTQGELPEKDWVTIRGLGTPEGGTVTSGGAAPMMVAVFIFVTGLGCFAILVFLRRRERRAAAAPPEDPAGEGDATAASTNGEVSELDHEWFPPAGVR
jgi:hypothetical protein